jgi:hypothetical protein
MTETQTRDLPEALLLFQAEVAAVVAEAAALKVEPRQLVAAVELADKVELLFMFHKEVSHGS